MYKLLIIIFRLFIYFRSSLTEVPMENILHLVTSRQFLCQQRRIKW